jgi:hypothetical protein
MFSQPQQEKTNMNLPISDVANRELSTGELDAVSAGLHLSFGPNPPRGGEYGGRDEHGGCHGGGCYGEPHQGGPLQGGPREFPGGVPNDPALRPHYF